MKDVIVRNLDKSTVESLKRLAARNGRSLQAEVKLIIERTAKTRPPTEYRELAGQVRALFDPR